jgi:hypothetical protein
VEEHGPVTGDLEQLMTPGDGSRRQGVEKQGAKDRAVDLGPRKFGIARTAVEVHSRACLVQHSDGVALVARDLVESVEQTAFLEGEQARVAVHIERLCSIVSTRD